MGNIDFRKMKWVHAPELYICDEDRLTMETQPHTYWKATTNIGPGAEIQYPVSGNFIFTVCTAFAYNLPFDQCGILLYNGGVQKAVICTEKKDDENLRLCVNVFNKEGGDRSMRDVGAALAQIFYRVLYRAGSCKIQYSFSGERYTDLREFHVDPAIGITDVCLYACSPGDSYCDCTFFDFNMIEDRRSEEIENDEC